MKLRKNHSTERAGVNAVRALFEASGHVFQEVDLGNDYGKDAYVDLVDGQQVTGVCVSLQIKSGESYRRASGYAIPVDDHEDIWRSSTLPLAGIVHDPSSGLLSWGSITTFLHEHPHALPATVPISVENLLTRETLESHFTPFFRTLAAQRSGALALLQVCSEREDLCAAAIMDCFAAGRSEPRVFVVLRYLLPKLSGKLLRLAIRILARLTPHPDIFWRPSNWVREEVCEAVKPCFRWSVDEITRMMSLHEFAELQRGGDGQNMYMLLTRDPEVETKIVEVAVRAVRNKNEDLAWGALYLAVYWAGTEGGGKLRELFGIEPAFRDLDMASELEELLSKQGRVMLFG